MDRNDRIMTIGASILAQAEKESRALIEKANATRAKELNEAEDKIMAQAGQKLQNEASAIRHTYHAGTAAARTGAREKLLRKRDDIARTVFQTAEKKLAAFASSEKYAPLMLGEIEAFTKGYDHATSTVYLAEKDMGLASAIQKLLPGAQVLPDEAMALGGWKFLNTAGAVMADQSFESRLTGQKQWFFANSGLTVTK